MVCLDREKKCYSSPVFFQNPKTKVQPAKNPNKTRILLFFKQSTLDFPRMRQTSAHTFPPAASAVIMICAG